MAKLKSTFANREKADKFHTKMRLKGYHPVMVLHRKGIKTRYIVEYYIPSRKGWI